MLFLPFLPLAALWATVSATHVWEMPNGRGEPSPEASLVFAYAEEAVFCADVLDSLHPGDLAKPYVVAGMVSVGPGVHRL